MGKVVSLAKFREQRQKTPTADTLDRLRDSLRFTPTPAEKVSSPYTQEQVIEVVGRLHVMLNEVSRLETEMPFQRTVQAREKYVIDAMEMRKKANALAETVGLVVRGGNGEYEIRPNNQK